MAVLTYEQVYALARGAGLSPASAVIATAIAKGESGFRTDAVGDVGIQTSKWGPSVGLWQVRSVKAETGKGTARDITRLKDPAFNARAMAEISGLGKTWKPWSVWLHGTYKSYLSPATAAGVAAEKDPSLLEKIKAGISATVSNPGLVAGAVTGSVTGAVSDAAASLNPFATWQNDVTGIAVKSLVVLAAGGLFVAGAIRLVIPATVNEVRQATGL